MVENTVKNAEHPSKLVSYGLFSERQIILPLLLSLLIGFATYLTFEHFYQATEAGDLSARYLNNPFCRLILFVFVIATLYAALHAIGLFVEHYHLRKFVEMDAPPPPLYALGCFVSGRRRSDEDLFFSTARRWCERARSGEELANLRDHLLVLREQQHQHNVAPLNLAVWALPLLGFIGTVVGITRAIGGLEEAVVASNANGGGLETVLSGLSFAFDTTFLGLVLVIPTMIYTLPLRAKAQKLDLCYQEILLARLLRDSGAEAVEPALIVPAAGANKKPSVG